MKSIVLMCAVLTVALVGGTDAQSYDEQTAYQRCQNEISFRIGRDNSGRDPEAILDNRRMNLRQTSRTEFEVTGPGLYRRDRNDGGRPFTYRCRVDVRSGRVDAQYQWSGGGFDDNDGRPSDYPPTRPPFGGGNGGGRPNGDVWKSGGLIGRGSGKALDVEGRSNRDAANVQLWQYGGGDNQKWDIIELGRDEYAIISQASNKALEVAGGSTRDGANIDQYRWNGGRHQRWRFERTPNDFYQIVNVQSGKCVDVAEAKTSNGANIQQWSCSGGANQSWKIQK